MQTSEVFSLANMIALPMWLLLIVFPAWKVTRWLIDFKAIPILLGLLYAFYIGRSILGGGAMDFSSLSSVMALFTVEEAVLAGWIHYLAFDLLVGMWMVDQNRKMGVHTALLAPCLLGTFMLGPVGFLLFVLLKFVKQRTLKTKKLLP